MVPEWLRWLLAAFACYRLAQMVAFDDWFLWLRDLAGAYAYDVNGKRSALGEFAHCIYCVGLVAASLIAPLALWPTAWGDIVLAFVGLAGAQAWLQDERRAAMRMSNRDGE